MTFPPFLPSLASLQNQSLSFYHQTSVKSIHCLPYSPRFILINIVFIIYPPLISGYLTDIIPSFLVVSLFYLPPVDDKSVDIVAIWLHWYDYCTKGSITIKALTCLVLSLSWLLSSSFPQFDYNCVPRHHFASIATPVPLIGQ